MATNKSTTNKTKMVSFRVPNHIHDKLPKEGLSQWLVSLVEREISQNQALEKRQTPVREKTRTVESKVNVGGVRSKVVEIGANFVGYESKEAAVSGSGMSIDTIRRRIKAGTDGFWQEFEDGTIQGQKPN